MADFKYSELEGFRITCEGHEDSTIKEAVIPYSVRREGKLCVVEKIAEKAFYEYENLSFVIIPASVTTIGPNAFTGCPKLTYVYIAGSPKIEANAFDHNVTTIWKEVPETDFMGFTFNGKHSYYDLNVIRTSEGNRYNIQLTPEIKDLTADNPSGDGVYYFDSTHRTKRFSVSFAFNSLTDKDLREWKKLCSNNDLCDLIFDEEPYKVYTAKITSPPSFNFLAFDETYSEGGEEKTRRVYKGEGKIDFTCYWPYAHTPNKSTKFSKKFSSKGIFGTDGKNQEAYAPFRNKNAWLEASGLQEGFDSGNGENYGTAPAPFVFSVDGSTSAKTTYRVGDLSIYVPNACYNLEWNSKTGLVIAASTVNGTKLPIYFTGKSCGNIPTTESLEKISYGRVESNGEITQMGTLEYEYWYY